MSFLTSLLNALPGAVAQGLIWGIMAIGVYITYRILDVADLTVDGSLATGGAVCVMLIRAGVSPWPALLCTMLAAMLAGLVTGLFHTKCGIPAILAGILTQLSLYSVNLRIMESKANQAVSVDKYDLLVSQPSSGEEALQICEALVRSNAIDVIVVDSVAALVTKQELEGEIGDSTVGAQARLMSAALRKLTSFISKARTVCIFTNQIREKIGVMFGNPETTPGGRALKFYASVRVDIRRIGQIKGSDGVIAGNRTKIKVVKNKVAPPFTECEFDIMYNEGISSVGSLLDLATEYDIIQKRGSWISYNGSQIAQGRDAAKEALKSNPELYAEIEEQVKAKMDEKTAK